MVIKLVYLFGGKSMGRGEGGGGKQSVLWECEGSTIFIYF